MIAEARRGQPALTFREGDAEALPFDAGRFDAVVMNFGLLHLARPDAELAEAHRVLRAGGRYAFTVWASPAAAVGFGLVLRAVETLGKKDVPLPEGPPFFRFSDAAETRRTLEHTAIRAAVRRGVESYARDGGFAVPMPAVLASATKP
jgi:ubiquinone/menaquinone biosynthesis C-methylase UbiE